jgi:hypothetical protein
VQRHNLTHERIPSGPIGLRFQLLSETADVIVDAAVEDGGFAFQTVTGEPLPEDDTPGDIKT